MKKLYVFLLVFLLVFTVGCKTESKHKIHFDTNGGASIESQEFESIDAVTLPSDPVKDGYVFDGWFIDEELETEFDLGMLEEEDTVIYAKWIELLSDVTIQLQAIYNTAISDGEFTGTYEEWLETVRGPQGLPGEDGREALFSIVDNVLVWKYEGDSNWTTLYDFSALNGLSAYDLYLLEHPDYEGTVSDWITEFFSVPEEVLFSVTFDSQGGTVVELQEVLKGEKAIEPMIPVRPGYIFEGWYYEDTDIEWVFVGYVVNEEMTLTAKWKQNIVTYNGVYDTDVEIGSLVDVTFGVEAYDLNGVDLTEYLVVSSTNCSIDEFGILDTTTAAVCTIEYAVDRDGFTNVLTSEVRVTEYDLFLEDSTVIKAWNFYEGVDQDEWDINAQDSSELYISNALVDNNVAMKLDVFSSTNPWTPQLNYTGLDLKEDHYYHVSLKAKSDIAGKVIHITLGEFLEEYPYFIPCKVDYRDMFTLTTQFQEYHFTFYMPYDSNDSSLVFDLGDLTGSIGIDAEIILDDIIITESDTMVEKTISTVAETYNLTTDPSVNIYGTVTHIIDDYRFSIDDPSGKTIIVFDWELQDLLFLSTQILKEGDLVYLEGQFHDYSSGCRIGNLTTINIISRNARPLPEDYHTYSLQEYRTSGNIREAFGKKIFLGGIEVTYINTYHNYVIFEDLASADGTYEMQLWVPNAEYYSMGEIFYGMEVVFYNSSNYTSIYATWDAVEVST